MLIDIAGTRETMATKDRKIDIRMNEAMHDNCMSLKIAFYSIKPFPKCHFHSKNIFRVASMTKKEEL
jgi:hypothetical protein